LEAGKTFVAQGRLDIAYELLSEALAIFHQVYGPMHADTANCYSNLAMVLYNAKDMTQALEHQQKAVIIHERVLGLDHHDTAQSYVRATVVRLIYKFMQANLALFCHNMGKPALALGYAKRALYLGILVSGVNHPDTATTLVCSL
jgi:protein TIF31